MIDALYAAFQSLVLDPRFMQAMYLLALVVAGMWATYKANEPLTRTFAVILANWLVLQTIVGATGNAAPVKAMLICDFIAGVIVLLPRVSWSQLFIGEVFFVQIGLHTAMLIGGEPTALSGAYLVAINALGWLQIALMLIGLNYGTGKRLRLAGGNRRNGRGASRHVGGGMAAQ